jgi:hypothetical protein
MWRLDELRTSNRKNHQELELQEMLSATQRQACSFGYCVRSKTIIIIIIIIIIITVKYTHY